MNQDRHVDTNCAEEPLEGRENPGVWRKLSGVLTSFPRAVLPTWIQIRSAVLDVCTPLALHSSEELGQMEDLEEAIPRDRQSPDLHIPPDSVHSLPSEDLFNAVMVRIIEAGGSIMNPTDIETAMYREQLARCPSTDPDRSTFLENLAHAIRRCFEQRGMIDDLEEAIAYYRESLELLPSGHPDRSASLNNLASSILIRYEQTGQADDLEVAIAYLREALDLRPTGHPDRSTSLSNLAGSIKTRYEQTGQADDLEVAIAYLREALDLCPTGHPDRSTSLNNLASSIKTRYQQTGQADDLEVSIAYHREALDLRPTGHPHRSASLNNLANSIITWYEQTGQADDLEVAIAYYREALDLRPTGHPDRSTSLSNLANANLKRFKQTGRMEDLDDAANFLSYAETSLPTYHPDNSKIWSRLAQIHLERHKLDPSDVHLSDAFSQYERSVNHDTASVMTRFFISLKWVSVARLHKHESTLRAYSTSLALLDRYVVSTTSVERKLGVSMSAKSLAMDAASCAIEAGEPETAIEFLDRGRTIILSAMRKHRHSLGELHEVDPDLAHEFETLSAQLERLATISESDWATKEFQATQVAFDVQQRRQRVLSEKWGEVVDRIRRVKGFADFLQAIPYATLQKAAVGGPVIVVNISQYRSDAIIVRGAGPPVIVSLPKDLFDDLASLAPKFSKPGASSKASFSNDLFPILRGLWDTIVGPVTDQLSRLGIAKNSRIWWCPTSHLCALPLHAAGPYRPGKACLPDLYISSYTATLSVLIAARSSIVPRTIAPDLLAIGDVGQPNSLIPNVEEELGRIMSFGDFVDVLFGEAANRDNIICGLQQHPWAHFSCHGHRHRQPFESSFQIYNGERLRLLDLVKAQLPNAELAFLSACHSAAADVKGAPDEVIHLASALQFCGFRSVVGTMWAMADIDGPDMAGDFYGYMFRERGSVADFRDSAKALNIATRKMRKRKGMTLNRWVNFIHIGA